MRDMSLGIDANRTGLVTFRDLARNLSRVYLWRAGIDRINRALPTAFHSPLRKRGRTFQSGPCDS